MPKYLRQVNQGVEAFKIRNDGPTPVPDWFPSNYEIVRVGIVFESSKGDYSLAPWGSYIVKYEGEDLLGVMSALTFENHFTLVP
jgi:hypothetical protein